MGQNIHFFLLIKTNNLRKHPFLFSTLTFTINAARKLNSQLRNAELYSHKQLTRLTATLPSSAWSFTSHAYTITLTCKSLKHQSMCVFEMNSVPMHFFLCFFLTLGNVKNLGREPQLKSAIICQ